jgi:hypothetical protein
MRHYSFLFFYLILSYSPGFGQKTLLVDSLKETLKNETTDTSKVILLNAIAWELSNGNAEQLKFQKEFLPKIL